MWERLAIVCCVALVGVSVPVVAAAQPPGQTSPTIVCLVLSPILALEPAVAGRLVLEVQTIWKVPGADIRSVDAPDDSCERIVVVKADREARPEDLSREDAIGWGTLHSPNDEQVQEIFVEVFRFLDRIR